MRNCLGLISIHPSFGSQRGLQTGSTVAGIVHFAYLGDPQSACGQDLFHKSWKLSKRGDIRWNGMHGN